MEADLITTGREFMLAVGAFNDALADLMQDRKPPHNASLRAVLLDAGVRATKAGEALRVAIERAERAPEPEYASHHGAWRSALIIALGTADNDADLTYWQHELAAFDREFPKPKGATP